MPQYSMADYGVVGLVLTIIIIIIWKSSELLKIYLGAKKDAKKTDILSLEAQEMKETKEILQGLTEAISKLTSFLETESAVDKEKQKASIRQLTDIKTELDKIEETEDAILKLLNEHILKCQMYCYKKE
jgi:Na+-transporting methylmalonyl-CoA/oxaloacetate decarboxylase gamma subunit